VIDHLVYAVSDLDQGIDLIESLTGVRPSVGGSHPGWGTRNALLGLGERCYLEIIALDPNQAVDRRPLGVDRTDLPRLTAWAAAVDLRGRVATAMERVLPDGSVLKWRLTDPFEDREGGLLPFLIDWGDSPHPAARAPEGCCLESFWLSHPDPEYLQGRLNEIGISVEVREGPASIHAVIEAPNGVFRF
jgi:hypothetical protein